METETSSCISLEMLPLSVGALIENQSNIRKSHKKLSSFTTLPTPFMERESFATLLDKTKVNTGAVSAFDIPSTDIGASNGDLEKNLKSCMELYSVASTLSLNEEAFINEINKLEEDDLSVFKTITLNEMDVILGTAKLVQSSIEARAVRIVPLNTSSIASKPSELSEEDDFQKGVRFSESPKVSFILPKEKIREVIIPVSDSVVPPNWSPCSRYTARHWKNNIPPTPRTPYNSLTPSESSHISNESTSDARECFKILCLMILGSLEIGLLLSIVNFVATDTITGALILVSLCALFVLTLLCGIIVVKNGGPRCGGEMSCIV